MKRILLGATLALGAGCMGSRVSGPPVVAASDKDVIWVTRSFEISTESEKTVMHGLFACYRPPAEKPGEPTCYLAKYMSGGGRVIPTDLVFPAQSRGASKKRFAEEEE